MSDEYDYYFQVPHAHLVYKVVEVTVRQFGDRWQFSYGYQLPETGLGTPFTGDLPTRESAGRNGMFFLRDELNRLAKYEGRGLGEDKKLAAKYADQIQEFLLPKQPDLFDMGRGAA